MSDVIRKKLIFCANEQMETSHVLSSSSSGEVVATCEICGRILKFPAGIDRDTFGDLLVQQKADNEGQITVESIDAMLADLADPEE